MVEEKLNLKETYYLIFSNINDKFEKLINNEYLLKVNKENVKYELLEKNVESLNVIKEDIKENIKDYKIYDLPLYYPQDSNLKDSIENQYNQYLFNNLSNETMYSKIYLNEYISKINDKFYLYETKSEESIELDLSETSKEEELDILYEYTKIEITQELFYEKLNKIVKNISLKYFYNMGLDLNKDNNNFEFKLTKDLENNLDKSIFKYIYEKHTDKINLLKNTNYKHLSDEEFKYQFLNKLIDLSEDNFLNSSIKNEFYYLKNIFSNILYEDLNKESLLSIKNYISLAINNFNDFLINQKDKVLNSFNNLFLEKEVVKNVDLLTIEQNIEYKINNKDSINVENNFILNEDDLKWNKIKAFLFESLISKESFFNDFSKNLRDAFPKHINKRVNDKIYHIDLENQSILWSFSDKEKDLDYQKEKKELFNKLKQEYIEENSEITKEELRTKLNPIISRELSPNEFIEHIGYEDEQYENSNLNLLNKVLNEKVEVFYNNLLYSFELFKNNYSEDYFKDVKKYDKETNYFTILNDIIDKYKLDNKDSFNLINLVNNNDIEFNDYKFINNILEYIEDDKQEISKKILSEYIYTMLNKTIDVLKPIQFDNSISTNSSCFKDFYVVRKIMSIAKDYLENNKIVYDINNIEKEKFDLDLICDINNNDKLNLCSYFDNIDLNIMNDISDVEDFLKHSEEDKELSSIESDDDDLDIIKF